MTGFPAAARVALGDAQMRRNVGKATSTIRARRAEVVSEVPDWEALRAAGAAIKQRAMATLGDQLEALESAVTGAGGTVHWARDAAEANAVVINVARRHGVREVIKSKSMATEEIGLNAALAGAGIEAIETDLAELIVQLASDRPSHILVPAIHRNREEIRALFAATIARDCELSSDPRALCDAARAHLREKFLSVPMAVSGANFGIAETGTICVVESEGNGRFCTTLPDVLVTVMGVEKVLPEWRDLEVMLQLLPRSSTGERMNPYNSFWTGIREGDGPSEFHLILLDNGRTQVLADDVGRQALHCIRCSACLNVCPVYSRTGGHAYESVYPGPIGAILTPQLRGLAGRRRCRGRRRSAAPATTPAPSRSTFRRFSCTSGGGSCARRAGSRPRGACHGLASRVFASQQRYERAQRLARLGHGPLARMRVGPLRGWVDMRDIPDVPAHSFRDWWRSRR
jgi:L-lactate dehydrogenase complex protein LldF